MGWLALTIAGLFIPHRSRGSVGGRSLGGAGACLTIESSAAPVGFTGTCDWSEFFDEVPRWRVAQQAWAGALGVPLPDYRTRSEFEAAQTKSLAALELCGQLTVEQVKQAVTVDVAFHSAIEPDPANEPEAEPEPEFQSVPDGPRLLKPRDAAETFLADLRELGETGPHDDARMSQLYAEHCARYDLVPTPENTMRAQLKMMPGIWKQRADRAKSVTGSKRERKYVWMVSANAPSTRVAA